MAGEPGQWWPDKLKYLEANYERCKLKVRQNSLYCKLFILEHQTQLEEERRITAKYEIKAVREQLKQAEQKYLDLANEKDILAKEWKAKTEKLREEINSLQEEKEKEIKYKDDYILELTRKLQDLERLSHSKDVQEAPNSDEHSQNRRNFDENQENVVSEKDNCQKSDPLNNNTSPNIVHEKAKLASEKKIADCDVGEPNIELDNSEKSEDSCGEDFLESEVGSVFEVTEELLKNSRRRSALKRKKPEVCQPVFENRNSNTVELNECSKSGKKPGERRVTFNGELEFKLPDGSKEVVELLNDDSNEQLEISEDENNDRSESEVFDDILLRETQGIENELYTGYHALKEDVKDKKDMDRTTAEKTKNLKGDADHELEVKSKTTSCEVREEVVHRENAEIPALCENEAEGSGIQQESEKEVKRSEVKCKSNVEGSLEDKEKDKTEISDKSDSQFLAEKDVLLSADREDKDAQFNPDSVCCCDTSLDTKVEDNVIEVKRKSGDDLIAQPGETVEREGHVGPRRGLRREAKGSKNARSSKRLLEVLADDMKPNEMGNGKCDKGKGKLNRKTRGKKKVARKEVNHSPISNANLKEKEDPKSLDECQEVVLKGKVASNDENKSKKKKSQKPSTKSNDERKYVVKMEGKHEDKNEAKMDGDIHANSKKFNLRSKKRKSAGYENEKENIEEEENLNDSVDNRNDEKQDASEEEEEREKETRKVNRIIGNKPKKGNLGSKKRKSLEDETDDEDNNENHEEVEDEREQQVNKKNKNQIEEKKRKQRKRSLRSNKIKSPERENNTQNNDTLDMNEFEKAEAKMGEGKDANLSWNQEKVRKTTRKSKTRKSGAGKFIDLKQSKEVVESQGGEFDGDHRDMSEEDKSNKTPAAKRTKISEKKPDGIVVSPVGKPSPQKEKESKPDDDKKGVDLGVEDEDYEVKNKEIDGEEKENEGNKMNRRGRKRILDENHDNTVKVNGEDQDHVEKMECEIVKEREDDEIEDNSARKSKKRRRKRDSTQNETKEKELKQKGVEVKRSEKGRSVKTNRQEINEKRELPEKKEQQEKPIKKRRTLHSIRENTTLFNATSSIFQETLPLNKTRSSTGMPPTLSAFMKSFIVPKLKKK